jgi:hypothetical protein
MYANKAKNDKRRTVTEITNGFLISFPYEEIYIRFKVFSAVTMDTIFWDVTL